MYFLGNHLPFGYIPINFHFVCNFIYKKKRIQQNICINVDDKWQIKWEKNPWKHEKMKKK